MKYNKFIIKSYRGITSEIIIDFEKSSLIPIIGINESGKTTLLKAIQTFDRFNDENNDGEHLKDKENLYSTESNDVIVEADISILGDDIKSCIVKLKNRFSNDLSKAKTTQDQKEASETFQKLAEYEDIYENVLLKSLDDDDTWRIKVGRNLSKMQYYFYDLSLFQYPALNDLLIFEFCSYLPYILYFDDFRDRIDDKLEIISNPPESSWLEIINRLFVKTNYRYSLYELPSRPESIRRSIISEVEEKLNEELTKEWAKFSIQQAEPLSIKINYLTSDDKHYIEFLIVERVSINGKERDRFFKLKDRSKGFYWYFNFIMKLVFNPKARSYDDSDTVYLLDEPGSYLHSTAQTKLTERLKQLSKKSKVIYCTHSPYLLDPKIIPINHIKIAEKDGQGNIEFKSIFEAKSKITKKNSAFQPILDALEIKPSLLNYDLENIILVEGLYDFLSFEMFKGEQELNFFPCANAETVIHHISYMFFLKKKFVALWDNDTEGIAQQKRALTYFGDFGRNNFLLLPSVGNKKKTRLEDLYNKQEILSYKKNNELPANLSFEKIIMHLYYNNKRNHVLPTVFVSTTKNFQDVLEEINRNLK